MRQYHAGDNPGRQHNQYPQVQQQEQGQIVSFPSSTSVPMYSFPIQPQMGLGNNNVPASFPYIGMVPAGYTLQRDTNVTGPTAPAPQAVLQSFNSNGVAGTSMMTAIPIMLVPNNISGGVGTNSNMQTAMVWMSAPNSQHFMQSQYIVPSSSFPVPYNNGATEGAISSVAFPQHAIMPQQPKQEEESDTIYYEY
jgi:hypothetical protein